MIFNSLPRCSVQFSSKFSSTFSVLAGALIFIQSLNRAAERRLFGVVVAL